MKDSSQLSKRERQIMDVIYAHGEATISQVLADMPDPPMRGALRTLLRIMEQKGHLTRRQNGRAIIYRPTQARGRAGRSALGRVLDVFFNGSLEQAVAAHLSDPGRKSKLDKAELQRLAALVQQAKKKGRSLSQLTTLEHLIAAAPTLLSMLLDAAIKGAAILVLTALTTLAMRRASAAARHLVWFLGAFSLLILPILVVALPSWHVLPDWAMNTSQRAKEQPPLPTKDSLIAISPAPSAVSTPPSFHPWPLANAPSFTNDLAQSPPVSISSQSVPSRSPFTWQAKILLIWIVGTALLLARIVLGFLSLAWLRHRSSRIVDGSWQTLLRELSARLRIRRRVEMLSSPHRSMPMTWGIWRTRVLVPAEANDWSAEQRRTVLLHELAHAKRRDCLTQIITQIACATYWFNPLVWLAWRRMQAEREQACDDLVLSAGTKASAYAEQLLKIATEMPAVRFSAAAIAMARPSKLEGRLRAILDTTRSRKRLAAMTIVLLTLFVGVEAGVLATLRADEPGDAALQTVRQWASHHGWKAQAIEKTTLESHAGDGWRNLPFTIDTTEESDLHTCVSVASKIRSSVDGKSEFADPGTRETIETILKNRPGLFYAEFVLSLWHRDHGDAQEAARLLDASYAHAPVIVVQRFQLADGSPLVHAAIQSFALECNRVQNGSLDPSLVLKYPDLQTDANGCIYLPVYNTVYRATSMAYPAGYTVDYPKLGWCETSRKVAMLPPAIVSALPGDFTIAAERNGPPVELFVEKLEPAYSTVSASLTSDFNALDATLPGGVSHISCNFVRRSEEGDVYEFGLQFPFDKKNPQAGATTSSAFTYRGQPLKLFEDKTQRIWIRPAPPVATATLDGNNKVSLLAIGAYPDSQNRWWLPDGSASAQQFESGRPSVNPWPQENSRRFVFDFAKPFAPDDHLEFRFSAPTSATNYYSNYRKQDSQKPYVVFAAFPTHPKSITMRLGHASGAWKTLAEFDPQTQTASGAMPDGFSISTANDEPNGGVRATLVHPTNDRQLRLMAIDHNDQEHVPSEAGFGITNEKKELYFIFHGLTPNAIKSIHLEVREYQWVEFNNIALDPGEGARSAPLATQPMQDRRERGAFSARLANGIEIDLLGVGENPSADKPWWNADGSALANPPHHHVEAVLGKRRPDELGRELGLVEKWGPVDWEHTATNWVITPTSAWASGTALDAQGKRLQLMTGESRKNLTEYNAFVVTTNEKTLTIRRDYAAGEYVERSSRTMGDAPPDAATPFRIDDPIERKNGDGSRGTTIEVSNVPPKQNCRADILLNDGRRVSAHYDGSRTDDAGIHHQFVLREYPPEQIRQIKLKSRPFDQWIEFRNVSMMPGVKTVVQIVTSDDSPSRTTQDAGDAKTIRLKLNSIATAQDDFAAAKQTEITPQTPMNVEWDFADPALATKTAGFAVQLLPVSADGVIDRRAPQQAPWSVVGLPPQVKRVQIGQSSGDLLSGGKWIVPGPISLGPFAIHVIALGEGKSPNELGQPIAMGFHRLRIQETEPAAATQPAAMTINGRVVDDETGEPVEHFTLQEGLLTPGKQEGVWLGRTTSSRWFDGRFSHTFARTAGQKSSLRVLADGYLPQPVIFDSPIPQKDGKANVEVRLQRGATVRGRVIDHTGAPVAGARIFAADDQSVELMNGAPVRDSTTGTSCDADGRFTVTGMRDGSRLVVSAPSMNAHRFAITSVKADAEIRLPQPGTLNVKYDIDGAAAQGEIRLELKTWEMADWVNIRCVQMTRVANKSEVAFTNLLPGAYDLVRYKTLRGANGRQMGGFLIDRRTVTIESGKTMQSDFVRPNGAAVSGQVVGMKELGLERSSILIGTADATGDPMSNDEWRLTIFDAQACDDDGRFTTSRLSPGEYAVIFHGFKPRPPETRYNSGIALPNYIAVAKIAVPSSGGPIEMKLEPKPYTPPRAATQPSTTRESQN